MVASCTRVAALLPLERQEPRGGRKGEHSDLHNTSSHPNAVDKRSVQYWIYPRSPNTEMKTS